MSQRTTPKTGTGADASPFGDNVIACYTRREALEDGVLVDVSETAREAGLRHPTALTRAVWDTYVAMPAGIAQEGIQSERGRLWDILWMASASIRFGQGRALTHNELLYDLYVRNEAGEKGQAKKITLKLHVGPGDDAKPVITILLVDED